MCFFATDKQQNPSARRRNRCCTWMGLATRRRNKVRLRSSPSLSAAAAYWDPIRRGDAQQLWRRTRLSCRSGSKVTSPQGLYRPVNLARVNSNQGSWTRSHWQLWGCEYPGSSDSLSDTLYD
ncbi:hypothetical protein CC2G_011395 [Coprinopsis cinerea AmutBmut pab1-1]|nr:hypothetical protein CC2G_011395 [Coprinopsis cinerea AmutBmut pab1-1]